MAMSRLIALIVLSVACAPAEPKSAADCDGVMGESAKNECYAKVAPAEFKADPAAGVAMVEEKITDQAVRDFVYLQVTREVDLSTLKYCERIKDEVLEDRCRVLVSRPHLQRPGTPGQGLGPAGGSAPSGTTVPGSGPGGVVPPPPTGSP